LKLTLILLEPLIQLLQLNVPLGYVVFDLGECLLLLLQARLVHLVEVDVGHERVALVAHAVLLLVDFGQPPLRGRGTQGAHRDAASLAVVLLFVLGDQDRGHLTRKGSVAKVAKILFLLKD
jgi:hypothetical protein